MEFLKAQLSSEQTLKAEVEAALGKNEDAEEGGGGGDPTLRVYAYSCHKYNTCRDRIKDS